MKRSPEHHESSGNVFADLGLANAPDLQAKADLAWEISRTIDERGLTQVEAAELLGIDQPKISALICGRFSGPSMERLYRFLNALGKDVEIVVRSPRSQNSDPGVHVLTPERRVAKRSSSKRATTRRLAKG